MPVDVEFVITEGWEKEKNKRFGGCAVALFKDAETGKTLFQFAPTLDHCDELEAFFKDVRTLDAHNKAIYAMKMRFEDISKRVTSSSCGGCDGEA